MSTDDKVIGRIVLTFYQHIDTVWLWKRSEGHQVVLSTWRSALDRLADHPDITYVITASEYVRVVAEHDPGMLTELQKYVREGRVQIIGGWVTEADCHVPSGESFARLELHGQAEFQKYFGKSATIAMNADAFGHDPGVIQVFRDTGKTAYLFLRPGDPPESDLPRAFLWQNFLVVRLTEGYQAGPNTFMPRVLACMADMEARHLDNTLMFAGLGNHGGEMSKVLLDRTEYLRTYFPIEHGTVEEFLNRIDRRGLPVVAGDKLKHHARGCYSANLRMKQQIRQTEQLLLTAEKMLAMLALSGAPEATKIVQQHSDQLVEAWRTDYLPSLFHDLVAGTAIRAGHEEAMDNLAAARSVARRAIDAAMQQITWNIKTSGTQDVTPVTVFNPSGHRAQIPTEVTFESHTMKAARLRTSDGEEVPCQRIRSDSVTSSRKRYCFVADVPAFGYATYWISETSEEPAPAAEATNTMIRTKLLELQIDAWTGQIRRLVNLRTSQAGPHVDAGILKDHSDTWTHGGAEYTQVQGTCGRASVKLVEHGPVRSVIASQSRLADSELVQEYIVYHDRPTVEVRSRLLWAGRRQVLKMYYAHSLGNAKITVEGSYGYNTDRDSGEQPMQKWLSVMGQAADGSEASFALITDSLHAYDAPDGCVRLTVLRSPVHAHHDPQKLDPEQLPFYDWMDQGEHRYNTLIMLGPEAADVAKVSEAAALFNQPPVNLVLTLRPTATLEQVASCAEILGEGVQMTACKRSLKDDGWIVRVFNPDGRSKFATLRFGGRKARLDMPASGFKTLLVPDDGGLIREVNILEDNK